MYSVIIVNDARDLERCFSIRREVFVAEQRVPEADEWDGRDPECTHFLAIADDDMNQAVGTARFCVLEDGNAKVQRVAVVSTARQKGVGRLLMSAVEKEALRRGFDALSLSAQTHSIDFYQRLGYHAFGDIYDDAGIPHRNMKKHLGATDV